MRQPYLKFYFRDWEADAELASCSLAAQGLWLRMMRVMHEANPYGHFLDRNGTPLDATTFARRIAKPRAEVTKLMQELEAAGVFSRRDDGTIFCRRMQRDEVKRLIAVTNGKHGGNPLLIQMAYPEGLTKPDENGLTKQVKTHVNNHSQSNTPRTIVLGARWLDEGVNPPDGWLGKLHAAFKAQERKILRNLSVEERLTLCRVHAAVLGNATVDESKNERHAVRIAPTMARLAATVRLGEITCRQYVKFGLKTLEIRGGKPFWNPFDVEAAIEYEPR